MGEPASPADANQAARPDGKGEGEGEGEGGELIWNKILREARKANLDNKTVVVVGDRQSGKSTLVASLEDSKEGAGDGVGLEYSFCDAKNPLDLSDTTTRLDIWSVDGEENHVGLLDTVITPTTVPNMLVLIVVDMAKPWDIEASLERWTQIVVDKVTAAWSSTPKEFAEAKKAIEVYFKKMRFSLPNKEGEEDPNFDDVPLEEGALDINVGVPIIIVPTRVDVLSSQQYVTTYGMREDKYDLIQQFLRRKALALGGAVVYTRAGTSKAQTQTLNDYIAHRLVGYAFNKEADEIDRERIFIPAGWDSLSKINGLCNIKDSISQVIPEPSKLKEEESKVLPTPSFNEFLQFEQGRQADKASMAKRQQANNIIFQPEVAVPAPRALPAEGSLRTDPNKAGRNEQAANFFQSILDNKRAGGRR